RGARISFRTRSSSSKRGRSAMVPTPIPEPRELRGGEPRASARHRPRHGRERYGISWERGGNYGARSKEGAKSQAGTRKCVSAERRCTRTKVHENEGAQR